VSTVSRQRIFTATHSATYRHRAGVYGGSQLAGSRSPLDWFTSSVIAASVRASPRSLANDRRFEVVHERAPESHASASATTWSMSRSAGAVQDLSSTYEYHRPPVSPHDEDTAGAVVASSINTS
jgi:hypothetical protein